MTPTDSAAPATPESAPPRRSALRWLIPLLVVANLAAAAAVYGVFGAAPFPAAIGDRYPNPEVRPEQLSVRAITAAEALDQAVVGGPAPSPAVAASSLSP